uniref:Uncharacterized protein n=1 Tax=Pyramimonas obovata TaxID=1411642 RepID=A0A7S0N1F1_9CHLO|mmetsp:Transcript_15947/g.34585  ORF Transcript_15947/g.34585 Transcript_15947/m.34585 type:complete len:203 (+) Transcript_15947:133-741(+)|eukprot:CAMPEP_0118935538 /NCGR_PEP_ID=MMETSP1169-20130426/15699_1 /TAXON_ID=36882 /ORGANISM="Pyramimonas obovata, Strain CCMP722" /LENGTH=202 /DNA_ID=CAMNT_0006878589 /DNA_START=118 /DNA_END=726 /DNA_ORIENTATION=-
MSAASLPVPTEQPPFWKPQNSTLPASISGEYKRKATEPPESEPVRFAQWTRQDLVKEVIRLTARCEELQKASAAAHASGLQPAAPKAAPVVNTPNLEVHAEKILSNMRKNIKAQLKWKPSCKTGSARWSYTTIVPEDVLKHILKIPANKPAKGCKLPVSDFTKLVGDCSASIRYGCLYITGLHVNLRYSDSELTASGSYGLP